MPRCAAEAVGWDHWSARSQPARHGHETSEPRASDEKVAYAGPLGSAWESMRFLSPCMQCGERSSSFGSVTSVLR